MLNQNGDNLKNRNQVVNIFCKASTNRLLQYGVTWPTRFTAFELK